MLCALSFTRLAAGDAKRKVTGLPRELMFNLRSPVL